MADERWLCSISPLWQRLRCLAHIIRKSRGLAESYDAQAAAFGEKVLKFLSLFIRGIYAACGDPSLNLPEKFAQELTQLRELCEQHRDHPHDKTRGLARELLNDWDAIWNVLTYPELPITNNVAERALRHWVIARKIRYGTRTQQGSRAYPLIGQRHRHMPATGYCALALHRPGDCRASPGQPSPVPSPADCLGIPTVFMGG